MWGTCSRSKETENAAKCNISIIEFYISNLINTIKDIWKLIGGILMWTSYPIIDMTDVEMYDNGAVVMS